MVLASNTDNISDDLLKKVSDVADIIWEYDGIESSFHNKDSSFTQFHSRIDSNTIFQPEEAIKVSPVFDNGNIRPVLLSPSGSRRSNFKAELTNLRFQR